MALFERELGLPRGNEAGEDFVLFEQTKRQSLAFGPQAA